MDCSVCMATSINKDKGIKNCDPFIVSYPENMDFSMTFLGLTKPYRESRIAACSSISQRNNGDVAAGSQNGITRWRFPRANGALIPADNCWEKIGSISGCLWSLSQTPFSLPKQARGVTSLKKLC